MDTTLRKTRHVLPEDTVSLINSTTDTEIRNDFLAAIRLAGWTLQSLADATGLTRERVRQIVAKAHATRNVLPVPQPPAKATKPKPVYIEPDPGVLARLQALQPAAQLARGEGSTYYEQGVEYSRLIWEQHSEKGVTLYRMAKRLGVTHGALRFRLARYGYKIPDGGGKVAPGKSKVYQPLKHKVSVSEN